MNEYDLSRIIINLAIKVHKNLGPGLLESVYKKALTYEFKNRNIEIETQKEIPIKIKGYS